MDWQEYFSDSRCLVETVQARLTAEQENIRYVNMRYKQYGQPETKWLYNVTAILRGEILVLRQDEEGRSTEIPLETLEYLKMRPFYYATCVGFKEFVLYAYPEPLSSEPAEH